MYTFKKIEGKVAHMLQGKISNSKLDQTLKEHVAETVPSKF